MRRKGSGGRASNAIRKTLPLWTLIAATGAAVPSAQAQTYVPTTTKQTQKRVLWTDSNCIFVRPNSAGSADIDDGSDLNAIQKALDRWEEATKDCSYMRFERLPPSPKATKNFNRHGPNENVIVWVESNWPHDPQAAGITTLTFDDNPGSPTEGKIFDADIEINGQFFKYGTDGADDRTDVENTVVHELGHLLGLDHTCDDGQRVPTPKDNTGETIPKCTRPLSKLPEDVREATMFNFAQPGETKKRTPEAGDIRGICEAYPLKDDPGVCAAIDLTGTDSGCNYQPQPGDSSTPVFLAVLSVGAVLFAGWTWRRRLAKKA